MFCGDFSDTVIEHFMCPRNAGNMPDANGEGTCGDPACGDSLTLYIKVKDNVITDISFLVFGCVAAIASSSMTTELAKGKTLEDALKITDNDIADALGGGAVDIFNEKGIEVIVGASGEVEKTVSDYLQGKLKSTGSICHEHQHADECES